MSSGRSRKFVGQAARRRSAARLCYAYCGALYRRFDAVFALSENGGAAKLRALGVDHVDVVPLGVELGEFGPSRRDPRLRAQARARRRPAAADLRRPARRREEAGRGGRGVPAPAAGARRPAGADRRGPAARARSRRSATPRSSCRAMSKDRAELARWLASADIYVSGMADETFGVSIIEAQASGLPVVGVAAGAMIDRVTDAHRPPRPGRRRRRRWRATSWRCGTATARRCARRRARKRCQFSWDRSMEALFGRRLSGRASSAAARAESARARDRGRSQPDAVQRSGSLGWIRQST